MVASAVKREAVAHLKAHLWLSERRACEIAGADRKMMCYQSRRVSDTALRSRLRNLANEQGAGSSCSDVRVNRPRAIVSIAKKDEQLASAKRALRPSAHEPRS